MVYDSLKNAHKENDLDMTQVVPEDGNLPFNSLMPSESVSYDSFFTEHSSFVVDYKLKYSV